MSEFASAGLTAGQLNAIVKKLGGHDMALSFLRGELVVSEPTRCWREENGVITFSVTSHGTTGEDWITRLESKGFRVGDYARQVLPSRDFKPTNGVTTEVAVLKGTLFEDHNRTTENIRAEADKRNWPSHTQKSPASSVRSSRTRRLKQWVCGSSLPCMNPSTAPTAIRAC
jgi:hypothetical protein